VKGSTDFGEQHMKDGSFTLYKNSFEIQVELTKSRFIITIVIMLLQTYLTARVRFFTL
jgi:hypothetical protein